MINPVTSDLKRLKGIVDAGNGTIHDCFNLGVLLLRVNDYARALELFGAVMKHTPLYPNVALGVGSCLVKMDSLQDALTYLNLALTQQPGNLNIHKQLATAYGRLGDRARAVHHGELVLQSLDRAACGRARTALLSVSKPPIFRAGRPRENIISFSLFGKEARYIEGAVNNASIAKDIYPGWRCRFYCDAQVPGRTIKKLRHLGAEVVKQGPLRRFADGLFWRFKVICDPNVKRFLVRDCDSLINTREQAAVNEWLRSDNLFHIMRDYYSHTDLILAGMWGGVANALPGLESLLKRFRYNPDTEESRIADQLFLAQEVWPIIKASCTIHDSVFFSFGAREFPGGSRLESGRTVGDNDYLTRANILQT